MEQFKTVFILTLRPILIQFSTIQIYGISQNPMKIFTKTQN